MNKKDINLINGNDIGWWSDFKISFAARNKEGKIDQLFKGDSCRSRLCDYLASLKYKNKYHLEYMFLPTGKPLDEYNTTLLITSGNPQKAISKSKELKDLHKYEENFGLEKTKIVRVKGKYTEEYGEKQTAFVIYGDIAWQSTMWKIAIYSYLIKKVILGIEETRYEEAFNKYFDLFMGNVKHNNEEIVKDYSYSSIHGDSGFHSIANGYNNTMLNILKKGLDNAKQTN